MQLLNFFSVVFLFILLSFLLIPGFIVMTADVVAIESVPHAVWVSGKCFVSLGLYCCGICTANPYAIAAGT